MTNTDAPWRPSADDLADLTGCDHIELRPGGREEIVDGVSEGFPYALVYSQHDRYQGRSVPWHWHQELELFYVLEGPVDYATSHERLTLPTGSAGIVNANVLHMTHATDDGPNVNLLIHMFRPQLLAERDCLLWRRYVEPLIRETPVELVYDVPRGPEGETALGGRVLAAFRTALARERGWE